MTKTLFLNESISRLVGTYFKFKLVDERLIVTRQNPEKNI